jgi:hypothetical protein
MSDKKPTYEEVCLERDDFKAKYFFMVQRAADRHLDGYRELGARCADLKRQLVALQGLAHVNVDQMHEEAMALADQATTLSGGEAQEVWRQAYHKEALAAQASFTQPSRSILFRSAATLALNSGDRTEAERLAMTGLADRDVPERVRSELWDVLARSTPERVR